MPSPVNHGPASPPAPFAHGTRAGIPVDAFSAAATKLPLHAVVLGVRGRSRAGARRSARVGTDAAPARPVPSGRKARGRSRSAPCVITPAPLCDAGFDVQQQTSRSLDGLRTARTSHPPAVSHAVRCRAHVVGRCMCWAGCADRPDYATGRTARGAAALPALRLLAGVGHADAGHEQQQRGTKLSTAAHTVRVHDTIFHSTRDTRPLIVSPATLAAPPTASGDPYRPRHGDAACYLHGGRVCPTIRRRRSHHRAVIDRSPSVAVRAHFTHIWGQLCGQPLPGPWMNEPGSVDNSWSVRGQLPPGSGCPRARRPVHGPVPDRTHNPPRRGTCPDDVHPHHPQALLLLLEISSSKTEEEQGRGWSGASGPRALDGDPDLGWHRFGRGSTVTGPAQPVPRHRRADRYADGPRSAPNP